jgi:hypothetical protein
MRPDWVGLGFFDTVGDGRAEVEVAVGMVVGRGSPFLISTQYELPILIPLQSFFTLGFYARVSFELIFPEPVIAYVVQELLVCQSPVRLEELTSHRAVKHCVKESAI